MLTDNYVGTWSEHLHSAQVSKWITRIKSPCDSDKSGRALNKRLFQPFRLQNECCDEFQREKMLGEDIKKIFFASPCSVFVPFTGDAPQRTRRLRSPDLWPKATWSISGPKQGLHLFLFSKIPFLPSHSSLPSFHKSPVTFEKFSDGVKSIGPRHHSEWKFNLVTEVASSVCFHRSNSRSVNLRDSQFQELWRVSRGYKILAMSLKSSNLKHVFALVSLRPGFTSNSASFPLNTCASSLDWGVFQSVSNTEPAARGYPNMRQPYTALPSVELGRVYYKDFIKKYEAYGEIKNQCLKLARGGSRNAWDWVC